MFSAASGEGAWLNGRRLQVSSTASLRDACGATGFPYGRLTSEVDNHREFCAFSALTRGLRRNGAAGLDLAWLAAGRFDFYWEYDLSRWDESGGILLVREAGGRVGAFREKAHVGVHRILASNGHLHEAALSLLESSVDYPVNDRRLLALFCQSISSMKSRGCVRLRPLASIKVCLTVRTMRNSWGEGFRVSELPWYCRCASL